MKNHTEIRGNNKHTKEEIDILLEEMENEILEICIELQSNYMLSNQNHGYSYVRILFNLSNGDYYIEDMGQEVDAELCKAIEDGRLIELYRFYPGEIEEEAEGLAELELDGEIEELNRRYYTDEIDEEEYNEKFYEMIQPLIEEYYEIDIGSEVEIEVDYLNAVRI